MITSEAYEAAIEAHNCACHIYRGVVAEYRAITIGDDEFLKAKAVMDEATRVFDIAFNAERDRPVEVEVIDEYDGQSDLF